MKIRSRNLDNTNFEVEITKKALGLKTHQLLRSMKSLYLGKKSVNFSVLFFLNCNKNSVFFFNITLNKATQLAQWRRDNVVTTPWLTLSQRCGTIENQSCGDVGLRRCDNVTVWLCQDVATTLLWYCHNIKHLIFRPFYYGKFWFYFRHRKVREL